MWKIRALREKDLDGKGDQFPEDRKVFDAAGASMSESEPVRRRESPERSDACNEGACFLFVANTSSQRTLGQRLGWPLCVGAALGRASILWPLTFIMPFQLSPVETRKRVRKAIPKFLKVACRPKPSQGCVSSHSGGRG